MAITLFTIVPAPAGGGSQVAPGPVTLAWPAGMQLHDFVWVFSVVRDTGVTISNNVDGGQIWTPHAQDDAANGVARIHTCDFNGDDSVDPQFQSSGSADTFSNIMFVWRPTAGKIMSVDVAQVYGALTTGAGVKTITGITTLTAGSVVIPVWRIPDVEDWSALTGGWTPAIDHDNLGGNDTNVFAAYKVMGAAGASGGVSATNANGFDPGRTTIMALKEEGSSTPTERSRQYSIAEILAVATRGFSAHLKGTGWWREALA